MPHASSFRPCRTSIFGPLADDAVEQGIAAPAHPLGITQMQKIEVAIGTWDNTWVTKHPQRRGQLVVHPASTAIFGTVHVVENAARHHDIGIVGVHRNARLAGLITLSIPYVQLNIGNLSIPADGRHQGCCEGNGAAQCQPCHARYCWAYSLAKYVKITSAPALWMLKSISGIALS